MKYKTLHHYNTTGHAHELTFSCYHRYHYLKDPIACQLLVDEIQQARIDFTFRLWAYVLMSNHVHLLIWPVNELYSIAAIEKQIKGRMSRKYGIHLNGFNPGLFKEYQIMFRGIPTFLFWQRGGGFDRNFWNGKPVHSAIQYIESNPVRAGFVTRPEDWKWSSAYAREKKEGLIPDDVGIPVLV
jgi:putative transposase